MSPESVQARQHICEACCLHGQEILELIMLQTTSIPHFVVPSWRLTTIEALAIEGFNHGSSERSLC